MERNTENLLFQYHHNFEGTAVQLVYSPFIQFVSQAQLYSQMQLSLQIDPIALGVPIFT